MGRSAKEGAIVSYIHTGSKLGVMLEVNSETDFVARTNEFTDFCRDVAMHIAANAPLGVDREALDPEAVERERTILKEQTLAEGKPEKVLDRIVEGRLEKYYQDVCLLEQPFVKDPDKTVNDLLTELRAQSGENVQIRRFVRFVLGDEG
jgi:elongation factor Ts